MNNAKSEKEKILNRLKSNAKLRDAKMAEEKQSIYYGSNISRKVETNKLMV